MVPNKNLSDFAVMLHGVSNHQPAALFVQQFDWLFKISASLALCDNTQVTIGFPHNGPVMTKAFLGHDVVMNTSSTLKQPTKPSGAGFIWEQRYVGIPTTIYVQPFIEEMYCIGGRVPMCVRLQNLPWYKTGLVSRQVLYLLSKLQNWIWPKTGQYKTCLVSNTKTETSIRATKPKPWLVTKVQYINLSEERHV